MRLFSNRNFIIKNIFNIRQFITSTELLFPKCSDCKYFIKHIENGKQHDGLGKCKKNGYNLLSGPVYFYALSCRNSEIMCGIKGKFFHE